MIFIIIGIIILFVSFFVALSSLIREQNKIDKSTSGDRYTGGRVSKSVPSSGPSSDFDNKVHKLASINKPQATVKPKSVRGDNQYQQVKRDSFPWESGYNDDKDEDEPERDEQILKIRAELAKLKAEENVADSDTAMNIEPMSLPDMPKSGTLSGEFSLSEYRKKAGNN